MAQYSKDPCKKDDLQCLWETVFGDSRKVTDAFFDNAFDSDGCFYIAAEGKAVSALYLLPVSFADQKGYYLYAAATLPSYRGQGLMGMLLTEALVYARQQGDFVYLCPAEESLYDYYRKHGFETVLYARYLSDADTEGIIGADKMYAYSQSLADAPVFLPTVYRYAEQIGCEMFFEGGTRFCDFAVYPVSRNVCGGTVQPYGMLAAFKESQNFDGLFAFLTMN